MNVAELRDHLAVLDGELPVLTAVNVLSRDGGTLELLEVDLVELRPRGRRCVVLHVCGAVAGQGAS